MAPFWGAPPPQESQRDARGASTSLARQRGASPERGAPAAAPSGYAAPRGKKLTFNFGCMTADEVAYATHAIATARGVQRLRLLHAPARSAPRAPARRGVPGPLAASPGACARLAAALAAHLRGSDSLAEFELGFALPPKELQALGAAISRCAPLRRLSFAGAPIGDAGLLRLLDGLQAAPKVEQLCLSSCGLSDQSGAALAQLIREHAHQRAYCDWRATLRVYPAADVAWPVAATPAGSPSRRAATSPAPGPTPVLGLIHLDLSCNPNLGLATAQNLAAALEPQRHATRLRTLDLRRCGLPASAGDYLADVMRRGTPLAIADCRHNGPAGGALGVVCRSLEGGRYDVEHLTAPPTEGGVVNGGNGRGVKGSGGSAGALVCQPPMRLGRLAVSRAAAPRAALQAEAAAEAARGAAAARAQAARRAAQRAAQSPLAPRRPATAPLPRRGAASVEQAKIDALTASLTTALMQLEAAVGRAEQAAPPWQQHGESRLPRGGGGGSHAARAAAAAASGATPRSGTAWTGGNGTFGGHFGGELFGGGEEGPRGSHSSDDVASGDAGDDSWDDIFAVAGGPSRGATSARAATLRTESLFRDAAAAAQEAATGLVADAFLAEARRERDAWADGADVAGDVADDDGDFEDGFSDTGSSAQPARVPRGMEALFTRAADVDDGGYSSSDGGGPARSPQRPAPPPPPPPPLQTSEALVAAVAAQLRELCDLRDR